MAETRQQPVDLKPERIDTYREWQAAQKIPVIRGFFVEDVNTVELVPWDLKGGNAAFVVIDGTGGVNDDYICVIAIGSCSASVLLVTITIFMINIFHKVDFVFENDYAFLSVRSEYRGLLQWQGRSDGPIFHDDEFRSRYPQYQARRLQRARQRQHQHEIRSRQANHGGAHLGVSGGDLQKSPPPRARGSRDYSQRP